MTGIDDEPELTETQKAYNIAKYKLFQLAAFGHHTHAPLTDRKTGKYLSIREIEAGQKDYNDRISRTQAQFEVAVMRLAAEALDTLPADATSFDRAEHKYQGGAAAERLRGMADELEAEEADR